LKSLSSADNFELTLCSTYRENKKLLVYNQLKSADISQTKRPAKMGKSIGACSGISFPQELEKAKL
jgi:hypothetical protein